ncbi:MAG TPA: hypothetical protein VKK79_21640, partial [Candidatus Lokiarchaeia archaeon]|nr:hypothetical protein [Candidatus Lokiarchaeia archaeon]
MEDAAETPQSEENNQENDQSGNLNDSNGKKERTLAGAYRFLMLGGGFFEIVLGVGIFLVVNLLLVEQISLAYPYITPDLLLFLQIWGAAGMVVPGTLLVIG